MNTAKLKETIKQNVKDSVKENINRLSQTSSDRLDNLPFTHMTIRDIHMTLQRIARDWDYFGANPVVKDIIEDRLSSVADVSRVFSGEQEVMVEEVIDRLKNYIYMNIKNYAPATEPDVDGTPLYRGADNEKRAAASYLNRGFTRSFIKAYGQI